MCRVVPRIARLATTMNSVVEQTPAKTLSKAAALSNFDRAAFDTYLTFLRQVWDVNPSDGKLVLSHAKNAWGAKGEGFTAFPSKAFELTDAGLDAAWAWAQQQSDRPVYANVALRHRTVRVGDFKRGDQSEVFFPAMLCMDFDVAGPAHKSEDLPSMELVREAIAAFPYAPTFVAHTGNGLHVYWALDAAESELLADKALRSDFADYWGGWFLERGVKDTDKVTKSPAHLMRLLGSTNSKASSDTPYAKVLVESYKPENVTSLEAMKALVIVPKAEKVARVRREAKDRVALVRATNPGIDALPGDLINAAIPLHEILLEAFYDDLEHVLDRAGAKWLSWHGEGQSVRAEIDAEDGFWKTTAWGPATARLLHIETHTPTPTFGWLYRLTGEDRFLAVKLAKRLMVEGLEAAAAFMKLEPGRDEAIAYLETDLNLPEDTDEAIAVDVAISNIESGMHHTADEPSDDTAQTDHDAEMAYLEQVWEQDEDRYSSDRSYDDYEAPEPAAAPVAKVAKSGELNDFGFSAKNMRLASKMARTDFGIADRLVIHAQGKLVYNGDEDLWHYYDNGIWLADTTGRKARALVGDVIRSMALEAEIVAKNDVNLAAAKAVTAEASQSGDLEAHAKAKIAEKAAWDACVGKLLRWAEGCENGLIHKTAGLDGALDRLTVSGSAWNNGMWEINTKNGVVDIRTLVQTPHAPEQYNLQQTAVGWVPGSSLTAVDLLKGLESIDNIAEGMLEFFQRALGTAVTGSQAAKLILDIFGISDSGKSTVINACVNALGKLGSPTSYAAVIKPKAISARTTDAEAAEPSIHRLRGKRLVVASESGEGYADAFRLNSLSGGDPESTRTLNSKPVDWTPECTIVRVGNYLPKGPAANAAYTSRLHVIELKVAIPRGVGMDDGLADRLKTEEHNLEAVLDMMIQAAHRWYRDGASRDALLAPEVIAEARAKFVGGGDLADWLEEVERPEGYTGRTEYLKASELHANYVLWCAKHSVPQQRRLGRGKLVEELAALGFKPGGRRTLRENGVERSGAFYDGLMLGGLELGGMEEVEVLGGVTQEF